MSIAKQIFLLLVLQLTFLSCESTDINSTDNNFSENFGAAVSRDFIGQVVDTDNHPIQSVTIKIGTTSVQTDVNGVFIINGASVYEKFAYITAKKPGYIDGSRAMVPTSGKNNVRIMLLQDAPLQTIQSGVTSEVSIYSGTKVVFDGAFMDENGVSYSGAVAVSMFHLTPSDENISNLMPGILYAQNENGQEGVLETFGMMHVELRGTNGQKLQIATGHKAQITLRIDDSQLATCPSTIPLWHFDEQNGYWKEEGSATKNGNYYVGNVSHFSWWNCDTFLSTSNLTVTVVNSIGNPISNVGVSLAINSTNFNSYIQYTDNNGQVSGLIPKNQVLTLKIYNTCNDIIYTEQIGPFSTDTLLQNITMSNSQITQSKIVGTLLRCDNTNVTNGYVILNYGNESLFCTVSNGAFSFNTTYCTSTTNFNLKGIDYDNQQITDSISYNFTATETNVGNLKACNSVNEFISYTFGNNYSVFTTDNIDTQSSNTVGSQINMGNGGDPIQLSISYNFGLQNTERISILTTSNNLGDYTFPNARIDLGENSNPNYYHFHQFITPLSYMSSGFSVKVNKFGAVGDYIDVSFEGTLTYNEGPSGQQVTKTLSGIAHVIRDN